MNISPLSSLDAGQLLVDLHLMTKADLYSFMQCSFVKIQDVIGYVSEYMLLLNSIYSLTLPITFWF